MRTFTPASWGKMLLAGIAVLIVGGPGFVLADGGPNPDYLIPRSGRLNGPSTVSNGSNNIYTLTVFFQDGSSSVFGSPPATFSQTASVLGGNGSFTGNSYHASHTGKVTLKGEYSNGSGTANGFRAVTIQ